MQLFGPYMEFYAGQLQDEACTCSHSRGSAEPACENGTNIKAFETMAMTF